MNRLPLSPLLIHVRSAIDIGFKQKRRTSHQYFDDRAECVATSAGFKRLFIKRRLAASDKSLMRLDRLATNTGKCLDEFLMTCSTARESVKKIESVIMSFSLYFNYSYCREFVIAIPYYFSLDIELFLFYCW